MDVSIVEIVGKNLRNLRDRYGYAQKFVAEKIGVKNNTLSGYEAGRRLPDADILQKLADFYEVRVDYLLGRSDEQIKPLNLNEPNPDLFSKRLNKHRLLKGFTIEVFADLVELSPKTIEDLETNPSKLPVFNTVTKMADTLGVTSDYLYGYTNDHKGYGQGIFATDRPDILEHVKSNRVLNLGGDVEEYDEDEREIIENQIRLAHMLVLQKRREKAAKRKKK